MCLCLSQSGLITMILYSIGVSRYTYAYSTIHVTFSLFATHSSVP